MDEKKFPSLDIPFGIMNWYAQQIIIWQVEFYKSYIPNIYNYYMETSGCKSTFN